VPDLFPLAVDGDPNRTKWVMIISTNPGGLWGGSLTAAYIGDFDGTTFREDARYAYDGPAATTALATFDGSTYDAWTGTGSAFGNGPSAGALPNQPNINGYRGRSLLNSFHGGGVSTGTLTSPTFTITKRFINFLVGGASSTDANRVAVTLVVDGEVARWSTGNGRNTLDWVSWDVKDLVGRQGRIVVVDEDANADGRILVDEIGFSDEPARSGVERTPWLDWGKDNYAGITFNNAPDGRRLFVGWLNNWQYAQAATVPTIDSWRGQQSVPRELMLKTVDGRPELFQWPLREIDRLRAGELLRARDQRLVGERTLSAQGSALDIGLAIRPTGASHVGLKVLTGANGDETIVGYDVVAGRVYIDRTRSGTAAEKMAGFYGVHSGPLRLRDGVLNLRILVDNSIVEVFAENGALALTDLVYPASGSTGLKVFADEGSATVEELDVYRMQSIWTSAASNVSQ
jgi:sucrose-6-phosphate hydrolase SacC (GH32 family)